MRLLRAHLAAEAMVTSTLQMLKHRCRFLKVLNYLSIIKLFLKNYTVYPEKIKLSNVVLRWAKGSVPTAGRCLM